MRSLLAGLQARVRGLRYGFLAIPALAVAGFAGLAFTLVAVDRAWDGGVRFGIADDAEAARAVLTVIAGSLITVAGVTFSIMMVTLQLVSQQFSPRALRNFLGDRLSQVVMGTFIGVFVYCLLVLRTVATEGDGREAFQPALSVFVGIVAAVAALVLLVVFIDHMGRNIQVSSIAAAIAQTTLSAARTLYPEPYGSPGEEDPAALVREWESRGPAEEVFADRPGHVQSITLDDVPKQVGSPGLRVHVLVAPGDFVTLTQPIARVWPGADDGDVPQALKLATVIASERDIKQDVGFGIRQLADIATRAISPGVNDPTTAHTCIRYLQAVMERVASRPSPLPVRRYDGDVVVLAERRGFDAFVEAAYAQIGRYADDPRIAGALLHSAAVAAEVCDGPDAPERRRSLLAAAERIVEGARSGPLTSHDHDVLSAALGRVRDAAGAPTRQP